MNCDEVLVLIYDLVDGEISPNDQLLLNQHLQNCEHCQVTLKSVQKAEKFYQEEVLVNSQTSSTALAKNVWQHKNVISFPSTSRFSTQKILYYIGAIAASFVGFIYLAGSLAISHSISKIDFSTYFNSIDQFHYPKLEVSITQLSQIGRGILTLFLNLNPWTTQSNLVKLLTLLFTLLSVQFAFNYLYTQNKQDKNL